MSRLGEATHAYQVYLEANRTICEGDFDERFVKEMAEDLKKARREMEIAWLESLPELKEPE